MMFKGCSIATRIKLGSIYLLILSLLSHGLTCFGCILDYCDYLPSLQPRRHVLILNEQQTWKAEKTGVPYQALELDTVRKPSDTEATFGKKNRNNSH